MQPKYSTRSSFIRKCCPNGQSYEIGENGRQCAMDTLNFNVSILNATFYENCIEDNESGPKLDFVFMDACNTGASNNNKDPKHQMVLYSKLYGDILYVLQNGSLLTVDENFEAYDVHNNYCLDMNRNDGNLYAIVCDHKSNHQTKTNRVLRAEAYLYSTCLMISVPCLLLTAFFYVKIDELRDLHGKSLACHCICLAIAYSFLVVIQFQQDILLTITYFIQYFLLSCICWLCVLCFDICFKISWVNYLYLLQIMYKKNSIRLIVSTAIFQVHVLWHKYFSEHGRQILLLLCHSIGWFADSSCHSGFLTTHVWNTTVLYKRTTQLQHIYGGIIHCTGCHSVTLMLLLLAICTLFLWHTATEATTWKCTPRSNLWIWGVLQTQTNVSDEQTYIQVIVIAYFAHCFVTLFSPSLAFLR